MLNSTLEDFFTCFHLGSSGDAVSSCDKMCYNRKFPLVPVFLVVLDYDDISNVWVGRLFPSCSTVTFSKTSDVFGCSSFPHDFFTL